MLVARFHSQDLPKKERFACWFEMASQAHVRTHISSEHADDFRASMQVHDLGAVQVSSLSYPALRVSRTRRLIRQSDPDLLHVSLTSSGGVAINQTRRDAVVGAGNLVLYDTSMPCVVTNNERVSQTVLQVPRGLLGLRAKVIDRVLATPISVRRGIGAVMVKILGELTSPHNDYRPDETVRLNTVLLDLLAALFSDAVQEHRPMPADAWRHVLQVRILEFIQRRLADPGLAPARIAAEHQISLRYLHLLFRERGLSVAGWIREQRLDRCRRDLADSSLDARPVHAIGARWGFPDPAGFSRVFRDRFGLPPADYRRRLRTQMGMR